MSKVMGRVSFTEVPFPSMEVGKGGEGRRERGREREREGKGREKRGKRREKGKGEKRGKKGGIAPAMGPPWEGEENDKRAKQAQSLSRLGNRASARSRAKLD